MTRAIFITVRTGSTRLPTKALLPIGGKPTIEHLIERVKHSKLAERIILCTTELKADDVLCIIAEKQGIDCFRGPVEDKLVRWLGAACTFDVDSFVTADGDDLFCEPELIDLAFKQLEAGQAEFIETDSDLPCGAFSYAVKVSALERVCATKDTRDTEMMWTFFKDTGLFVVEKLRGFPEEYRRPKVRMTLDYQEDYEFFRTIITDLRRSHGYFDLKDILEYLDKHPKVIDINWHLQSMFMENQANRIRLAQKGDAQ